MAYSIICEACGIEAPTRRVEFYQNIGAVIMRFQSKVKGNLCKNCVHANFWRMTGTTLGIGWLGFISMIIAPLFILNNVVRYLSVIGMKPVPADARVPQITNDVAQRVFPLLPEIGQRLNNRERLADLAHEYAPKAGVTPGELFLYVLEVARREQEQMAAQRSTGGFPVVPTAPGTA